MRIIAGQHRGRKLAAPKGDGTRPTTDRVRESLMSAVASARGGFEGAVVLDAFAGSGALAFEALSRGAAQAVLGERAGAALRAIEANAAALGYGRDQARIARGDVLAHGFPAPPSGSAFDLVFLDPPYAMAPGEVLGSAAQADRAGHLAPDVLLCYEHDAAANDAVDAWLEGSPFVLYRRRAFGDTVIDLIEREERTA